MQIDKTDKFMVYVLSAIIAVLITVGLSLYLFSMIMSKITEA